MSNPTMELSSREKEENQKQTEKSESYQNDIINRKVTTIFHVETEAGSYDMFIASNQLSGHQLPNDEIVRTVNNVLQKFANEKKKREKREDKSPQFISLYTVANAIKLECTNIYYKITFMKGSGGGFIIHNKDLLEYYVFKSSVNGIDIGFDARQDITKKSEMRVLNEIIPFRNPNVDYPRHFAGNPQLVDFISTDEDDLIDTTSSDSLRLWTITLSSFFAYVSFIFKDPKPFLTFFNENYNPASSGFSYYGSKSKKHKVREERVLASKCLLYDLILRMNNSSILGQQSITIKKFCIYLIKEFDKTAKLSVTEMSSKSDKAQILAVKKRVFEIQVSCGYFENPEELEKLEPISREELDKAYERIVHVKVNTERFKKMCEQAEKDKKSGKLAATYYSTNDNKN